MATPEETNAAMRVIEQLQRRYTDGELGLPPGADWVDTAFAYLDHAGVYDDVARATEILDGYQVLVLPPPPEEQAPPAPEPPSFREAMDLPEWWAAFRAFAATEYATENPDFLDAVRYQTMDPRAIYDTFVASNAPQMINIASTNRVALDRAFSGEDAPGHDVFGPAVEEVVGLVQADTWPRFLRSGG